MAEDARLGNRFHLVLDVVDRVVPVEGLRYLVAVMRIQHVPPTGQLLALLHHVTHEDSEVLGFLLYPYERVPPELVLVRHHGLYHVLALRFAQRLVEEERALFHRLQVPLDLLHGRVVNEDCRPVEVPP